jgi:PST family polysaccharide transporter
VVVLNAFPVSVAGKAVKGIAWNLSTGLGVRILGMVGTLVLTHFIAPYEYGEVSAASICVLTAAMFSTVGFGQYIIARKAGPEETFHVTVYHIGLGLLAFAVVLSLGGPLGRALDAPHMVRFMPGLALAAFFERVQYVPERLLSRQLRFRTIALSRAAGELTFTVVSLSLARKYGGYAIVCGNLARGGLVALLVSLSADRREWLTPTRLRKDVTRDIFVYGVPISIGGFAEFVSQRWDNLLVSGIYGPELMGNYALAYNLAETPTGAVADQIGAVLLPSFAQMKPEERKSALLRSASLMGLLVFPLAVGLGAIAPTAVHTFFDRRWWDVAPMLTVLSILSVVKPLAWTLVAFTHAQQRPRVIMAMGIFKAVALVLFILVLGHLSMMWLCYSVGLAFAAYVTAFLYTLHRTDGVPFLGFIVRTIPPLIACVPMVIAVLAVRHGMLAAEYAQGKTMLIFELLAGAVTYVASALVIAHKSSRDFLNLLKNAMRRRRA